MAEYLQSAHRGGVTSVASPKLAQWLIAAAVHRSGVPLFWPALTAALGNAEKSHPESYHLWFHVQQGPHANSLARSDRGRCHAPVARSQCRTGLAHQWTTP